MGRICDNIPEGLKFKAVCASLPADVADLASRRTTVDVREKYMNVSDTERTSKSDSVVSSTATTRFSGSRLILARAVWLALVVPSVGLFVISLPVYYAQLQRACVNPVTCNVAFSLTAQ